jgi:hypothetical protein
MSKRSLVVMASFCALLIFSWAQAQEAGGGGRKRRAGGAGAGAAAAPGAGGEQEGGRRFNTATMMRERMNTIKEQMGATDEEWKELSPKIEKAMMLQRETRPMQGFGFAGGRRPGGEGRQPPAGPPSKVIEAQTELGKAIKEKNAPADDVAKKLADYREARDKARAELVVVQKDLKKSVKPREEAVLVLNGILD